MHCEKLKALMKRKLTCGGHQLTPMVEDMYYDVISGIPGVVGNVRCVAQ